MDQALLLKKTALLSHLRKQHNLEIIDSARKVAPASKASPPRLDWHRLLSLLASPAPQPQLLRGDLQNHRPHCEQLGEAGSRSALQSCFRCLQSGWGQQPLIQFTSQLFFPDFAHERVITQTLAAQLTEQAIRLARPDLLPSLLMLATNIACNRHSASALYPHVLSLQKACHPWLQPVDPQTQQVGSMFVDLIYNLCKFCPDERRAQQLAWCIGRLTTINVLNPSRELRKMITGLISPTRFLLEKFPEVIQAKGYLTVVILSLDIVQSHRDYLRWGALLACWASLGTQHQADYLACCPQLLETVLMHLEQKGPASAYCMQALSQLCQHCQFYSESNLLSANRCAELAAQAFGEGDYSTSAMTFVCECVSFLVSYGLDHPVLPMLLERVLEAVNQANQSQTWASSLVTAWASILMAKDGLPQCEQLVLRLRRQQGIQRLQVLASANSALQRQLAPLLSMLNYQHQA